MNFSTNAQEKSELYREKQRLCFHLPRRETVELVKEKDAGRGRGGARERLPHRRLARADVLREQFGTLQQKRRWRMHYSLTQCTPRS